jgi:hypothetical protein
MFRAVVILGVLFSTIAHASPDPVASPATTSYRSITLTTDAAAVAVTLGGILLRDHDDGSVAAKVMLSTGVIGVAFVTPIVHIARGHRLRGFGSYALRAGAASIGMLVAIGVGDCHDGFRCDAILPGVLGGFAVASVVDAAFLTDETAAAPPSWSPAVSATGDGVRLGARWSW